MEINRRLVNYFNDEDLRKLLSNPSRYRSLIIQRFNRRDGDPKLNDLAIIDALDNYIIKTLNTTPWLLNKQDLYAYRDFLYSIFNSRKSVVFDSILFRKGNLEKVFSDEQQKNIDLIKKQSTINANLELKRLMTARGQTASDLVLRFAETQIDVESDVVQNFVDNLFQYIINNQDVNNGYYAREFMARYVANSSVKDLNIPQVQVYLTNYDIRGVKIEPSEYGCSYGNSSVINVNKDYALGNKPSDGLPNFISVIHTVCHEVKHSSQAYNTSNGDFTLETFNYIKMLLFKEFLSTKDYNEYNTNYIHTEIESDSNYYGWRHTERIIKKFAPSMIVEIGTIISNSIVTAFQEETATKLNKSRKKRNSKERFNTEAMDEIMKSHPEILNKYPQLRQIYSPNGKRHSFMDRIKLAEHSSIRDIDKIYRDFDVYDFQTGEVHSIDVNALRPNEQFMLFRKIFNMTMDEIESCKNSIKVYEYYDNNTEFRKKEFNFIGITRVRRIIDLVSYINDHKDLITRLDSYNRKNGINQIFMIQLDYVRTFLKSMKDYSRKFKKKYSNDTEKAAMIAELDSLEQVEIFDSGSRK